MAQCYNNYGRKGDVDLGSEREDLDSVGRQRRRKNYNS